LQPRVTGQNVEASQVTAEYATDYIYRAYAECMKMTARKVSCLLKDSVNYGGKAYRNIVKAEDIGKRIFSTDIRFLPTQMQIQRFEAMMNQAIAASPELISFLDPFQLVRVAQEDVKLAELLFRQAQKKLILHQQQTAQQNQEATFQAQVESGRVAEEEKRKTKELEADADIRKAQMTGQAQNQTSVLNGAFSLLQKSIETGAQIPAQYMPLINAVMENVALSAVIDTKERQDAVRMRMQEAQMQQQMEQEQAQQQTLDQNQPQVAA
jgi:hypothetical protein